MRTASATANLYKASQSRVRQACTSYRFNTGNSPFFFLHNGYRLAYAEYGASNGTPVFYFHDSGSSRLEASLFHQAAQRNGFRIIAIDRPGIGKSEFFAYSRPADFCDAVMTLARQLGLQQFGVMSLGAGGLGALTMARFHSASVMCMLNLGGVPGSVFNETGEKLSYSASCWNELTPVAINWLVSLRHRFFRADPFENLKLLGTRLSASDRIILEDNAVLRVLVRDQEEAVQSGSRGIAQDIALSYRKLDFRLQDVSVPTVIWQGESDRLSQRSDCEFMAARMSDVRYHRVPGRGHFFFLNKMDQVFDDLRRVLSTRALGSAA